MAVTVIYICPFCLHCSDNAGDCSRAQMIRCEVGEPGSEARKPMQSPDGRILTRSPRWWVQAAPQRQQAARRTSLHD